MNKYFKVSVSTLITLAFCLMSFFTESSDGGFGYGFCAFVFGLATTLVIIDE